MIAVLDYGIGNLASMQKALEIVGGEVRLVTDPRAAEDADGVVLPGVGAFGACMNALRSSGLDVAVHSAIERGVPFLGVCVGMQMLFDESEESPGVPGLGVIPGRVVRMTGDVRLPQMQWNRLAILRESYLFAGLDEDAWLYFVHSFAAESTDSTIATCEYGSSVTAAVAVGNVVATQFHPEKSSRTGLHLLENYVKKVAA